MGRERIEVIAVGTNEMAEHRTGNNGVLMLQTVDNLIHIVDGIKAQAVHACIELYMYGPACDTLLTGCLDESIHQTERVDLRLEIVVEHGLEGGHLWIHDHDVGGDAGFAEGDALIGNCHSEIVDTVILQGLGNLHSTSAIGVGLDHTDHLRLGFQERTVVVQIIHHSVEVHLEDGLVDFLLQLFGNLIKAKRTGSLQEDEFIVEFTERLRVEKMVHIGKELLVGNLNLIRLSREFRPDADELVDATFQA